MHTLLNVFGHHKAGSVAGTAIMIATVTCLSMTAAYAQQFMSEEELLATFPGSTIDGKTDEGQDWAQAYSKYNGTKKKGKISGVWGENKYDSKWYVQDGQWCEDWGDGSACWQVERVSEKELRMYVDGKARPNLWVLR